MTQNQKHKFPTSINMQFSNPYSQTNSDIKLNPTGFDQNLNMQSINILFFLSLHSSHIIQNTVEIT